MVQSISPPLQESEETGLEMIACYSIGVEGENGVGEWESVKGN